MRIDHLTLLNSDAWNIVPENAEDVRISHVNILSGNDSDDGIDVVSSESVAIEGCFIRTKDDCIAVKALFKPEKSEDRCRNILVENCILWSAEYGNAIELGFELQYPLVENIAFKNLQVIREGAVFSIHNTDQATVRNITLENIHISNAMDKFVDLGIFMSYFSEDNPYTRDYFLANKYLNGPWTMRPSSPPKSAICRRARQY